MYFSLVAPVDARPEEIWNLFVDVERWPEFVASVSQVKRVDDGPLRVRSEALVKQPRLPEARWTVVELIADRSFTWETRSPGVTTIGSHVVERSGEGSTIALTLNQRGPLAFITSTLLGKTMRRYVTMELEGFKSRAEARSRE